MSEDKRNEVSLKRIRQDSAMNIIIEQTEITLKSDLKIEKLLELARKEMK